MPDFFLPDLGEGLEDGEVVRWLVAVGDAVSFDQPLVDVVTAKASVELPSPFEGVVTKLHARPGEVVKVGHRLITVSAAGEVATAEVSDTEGAADLKLSAARPAAGVDALPESPPGASPEPSPSELNGGSGNVLVGYGTWPERRRRRTARSAAPAASDHLSGGVDEASSSPSLNAPPAVMSPVVRRLARESGVDLRQVVGSGAHGVIIRADVERAVASVARGAIVSPSPDVVSPSPDVVSPSTDVVSPNPDVVSPNPDVVSPSSDGSPARTAPAPSTPDRVPIRGHHRLMAELVTRSRREIPEATVWVDVDAAALLEARQALADSGRRPALVSLVARFCSLGLQRYPLLNASIDGDEIVLHRNVNIGLAAQTDSGLVVPVVRGTEALSLAELDAEVRRLSEAARAGGLTPADLSSGTFTVNNYGVFGVDGSAAIINHPQVAMIGIGRVIERPWVVAGQIAIRPVAQLTLAFDHRVCDGGVAGGFLRYVADCVEQPLRAL